MTGKDGDRVLVTGGSGLLGRHLRMLLPNGRFPSAEDFDVRDYEQMRSFLGENPTEVVIHCAAITSPPRVDQEPILALDVNIIGTAHLVKLAAALRLRLVYISTDYVFDGESGMYREDDPVKPVNKYAWSKLGGETAVRMIDDSLIVRLSFGPEPFPYEKAFVDQWTSREPVAVSASKIVGLAMSDLRGVVHIGAARRTVMEYAQSIAGGRVLKPLRRDEVTFSVPKDTSLDTARYAASVSDLRNDHEGRGNP